MLAVASLVIAFLGATPARVSATELLGEPRAPGDAAFIASHRGGGATAPENTLPAISAALGAGFDYVEVDVALTADRQPVLMHDATVDRTTDGHGRLSSLTLAEVRALDAGSWFDAEYRRHRGADASRSSSMCWPASGHRAIVELKGVWDAAAVAGRGRQRSRRATSSDASRSRASMRGRSLMAAAASEVLPRLLILKHLPDDVVRAAAEAGVRGILVDRRACSSARRSSTSVHARRRAHRRLHAQQRLAVG